jgi:hypothetical protein
MAANAHYEMNISSVTGAPFCKGESFNLSFTIHFVFDPTNVFTVQMSNASGSFASPVNIGTGTGPGPATIACVIPANTPAGTGYKFRVVSSSPAETGDPTTATYTVVNTPAATLTATTPTTFCSGSSATLQANAGNNLQYTWYRNGIQEAVTSTATRNVTAGGNYTVKVTEGIAGCNATSANVKLTMKSKPTATVTPAGTDTICNGTTLTMNANAGTGLSYQWYKGTGIISGAVTPQFITGQPGNYRVLVTNTWGCTRYSAYKKVVRLNCNRDVLVSPDMKVWPNPFSTELFIALDGLEENATMEIYDMQGRQVYQGAISADASGSLNNLTTEHWDAGVYVLRILTPSSVQTQQLIKTN